MDRTILSDAQWQRIEPLLPTERGRKCRPYLQDHRTTIEGILWIARTGSPWRDLPPQFGKWITVYQRFNRWVKSGVFDAVFASLADELDLGVVMIDGTFVKVHQHGTGAPKEDARPTSPNPSSRSGEAGAGLPRRSSQSLTALAGSPSSG